VAPIVVLGCSIAACALADVVREPSTSRFSFFDGWEGESYGLDADARFVAEDQEIECAPQEMVKHRSKALRYAVIAHPDFVVRLERFEAFVTQLAIEHYGRAPRKLVHKGVFACRSMRTRTDRISEHALGNAIDLQGFDFGPLPKKALMPESMPRAMRRAFSVRVLKHGTPKRARDAYHAEFLHRLAEELRERPEIFRGIVGPPRPRHRDHLHLDAAPWRYAMFGYD
jgi:hypothetical protein